MFEDARITSLNSVITACREAADQYATAASIVEDEETSGRFRDYAGTRDRLAGELAEIMRRKGWLPKDVDPEKEALESLWLRFKAALRDDYSVLAKEVVKVESELKGRVQDARKENPPKQAVETLKALESEIFRTLEEIGRGGGSWG